MRCSARRAASMLSPPIEPEQSTRSLSRSGRSSADLGTSAQKLASATNLSPSFATTASDRPDKPPTASTKSRSRKASRASATRMPFAVALVEIAWEGEATVPFAISPSRSRVSENGYATARSFVGTWCAWSRAAFGSP